MKPRVWLAMSWVLVGTCLVHCTARHDDGSKLAAAAAAGAMAMPVPVSTESPANRLPPKAVLTGACDVLRLAGDPTMCKGIDELIACSAERCNLDACVAICQDHIGCAMAAEDQCQGSVSCERSPECSDCATDVLVCTLVSSCQGLIRCASGAQGGTCERLKACCMTQRNPEGCMGWAEGMGLLSGDPGCEMLLQDPKFIEAYASDPPCML